MTKDEAIKIIQTEMECVSRPDCDRLACAYCDLAMRDEDVLTAYQMALTALQTDGDCISRADVIELVKNSYYNLAESMEDTWAMVADVEKLPSVQPKEHTKERTETHACDCISRQVAIDTIIAKLDAIDHVPQWVFDELTGVIGELPSVQPEPCEDTISRADAIRIASGYCHPANVAEELAKLPSTQPDNSCDGCKYEDVDDGVLVPCGFCKRSYSDNYERRTDEGD